MRHEHHVVREMGVKRVLDRENVVLDERQIFSRMTVGRIGEREHVVLNERELLRGVDMSGVRDGEQVVLHQGETIGRVSVGRVLDDERYSRAVCGEHHVVTCVTVGGVRYDKDVVLDERGTVSYV